MVSGYPYESTWSPAKRARLRLVITLLCVIAAAVAISLVFFRSFLVPPDAEQRLEQFLEEREEEKLRGEPPQIERFPGPERESPDGP